MKFESLMLKTLFLAVCVMAGAVMVSMLSTRHDAVRLATHLKARETRVSLIQPLPCPLPPDGVICFRAG